MDFSAKNAAIHNASITKKYLLEQKIRLLDHPACSPDLSHIENLWGLIVANVYERGRPYSAISELKNVILNAWEKISSVQLQKLVCLVEFLRLSKLMENLQNIK